MSTQKNGHAVGFGLIVGAAVLWGTVGPAQVLARAPIGPAALGGWRLLVGGVVLGALSGPRLRRLRALAAPAVWRPLLMCALSTGLYQMTFLYSVSRTGAALATVVALGIAPVATGVCARWLTGEQVGIAWLVSTSGAVGGCALLLSPSSGRVDNVGLLLGGVAGICYGAYTAFAKKLATENPTLHVPTAAAASLVVGGLLLLPWMALDTSGLADLRTAGLVGWLGVATTAAAYWMFTAGLGRVSATAAGTLSLAEPLAASLLGVLVLGEDLSGTDLAGSLLLLGGLAGASLPNLRRGAWRVGTEQKAETVGKRLDH